MEWSKKIKEARNSVKMTQEELAFKIGVSRSTIANYEMGRRKPSLNELKQIANILHLDINFMLESEETNKEEELLSRANNVFNDLFITDEDKDLLFHDIMEIYLKGRNLRNDRKYRKEKL